MGELSNCPKCGELFVKSQFRDICHKCWNEEETAFDTVYQFLRKRENRAATIRQVDEATGIDEELIFKFVRTGRLKVTHFPNLGYPCDKCGKLIREGKLCETCAAELRKELDLHKADEERREEILKRQKHATYFTSSERKRDKN